MIGYAGAAAAYLMGWKAILSERRLTPTERRAALLRLPPKEVRRILLSTRLLFLIMGSLAVGLVLMPFPEPLNFRI